MWYTGPLRPTRQVLLLCALGAATFLPSLPMRDLWNPDEPRYAEVAREMVVTGEWLVPHLNGELYSEKPPLFFWLSALGQMAGLGFNAGRIVAGLAFLGTLLLTWSLARRHLGDRAALLGAAVLGTTLFFPWLARFGVLDVVLTFFVTLAVYGWVRGGRSIALFYVGIGLAVLVKGPVGIVLAVFGALSWRIAGGRGGRPWHVLWGVPLTAAIVAAWLWPACVRGGPVYTDAILWKQNVGRAVESFSHQRPFWYYLQYVWLFLPWLLLLPWAAPWAYRRKGLPRAMVLWAAIGFVFFSFVSGKRDRYLTPLFPPLAIVVGAWLDAADDALERPWVNTVVRLTNGFFFGVAVTFAIAPFVLGLVTDLDIVGAFSWPSALGALSVAAVIFLLARSGIRARRDGKLRRVAAVLALEMTVLLVAHDLLLVPRIDEIKSPRVVAEELNRWPGEVAFFPSNFSGAYHLYSGRLKIPVLETPEAVVAYFGKGGERLLLTSVEHFERKPPFREVLARRYRLSTDPGPAAPEAPSLWVTRVGRVGHRDMLFLTNYEPPPQPSGSGGGR